MGRRAVKSRIPTIALFLALVASGAFIAITIVLIGRALVGR